MEHYQRRARNGWLGGRRKGRCGGKWVWVGRGVDHVGLTGKDEEIIEGLNGKWVSGARKGRWCAHGGQMGLRESR